MTWLFDTTNYMPRVHCGNWSTAMITFDIISNAIIALAYIGIPFLLLFYWKRKRKTLPHAHVVFLFGLFILLCGSTHIVDAIMFFWPAYNFNVVLKIVTAIVSLTAFITLPKAILYLLDFKTPGEYKDLANQYYEELQLERKMSEDIEGTMQFLQHRIDRLEAEIKHKDWIDRNTLKIDELKNKLEHLSSRYKEMFDQRKNGAA